MSLALLPTCRVYVVPGFIRRRHEGVVLLGYADMPPLRQADESPDPMCLEQTTETHLSLEASWRT